jgi:hypothetical protein
VKKYYLEVAMSQQMVEREQSPPKMKSEGVPVRMAVPTKKMLAARPMVMRRFGFKLYPFGCWLWR